MIMKKRKPEIRFKGFEREWVVHNASSIFETYYDKNHPYLPVLSASQELGMVVRDSVGFRVQHNKENEAGYKRVLPGQFVIHLRSFQGGFAHSMVEEITSPAYTVMQFRKSGEQDDIYWKYVLTSKTFIKRLETVTYGIRDGRSISFEDFSELKFTYPSVFEQEKIGAFLTTLDNLIAKLDAKLDRLRKLKQALLENMFVDALSGQSVPQIRFKGYTDKWEVKELRDVAKLRRGLTYSPGDVCSEREGIRVLRSSNISEDIFLLSKDDVFVKQSAVNIPYIHNYDILITAANGSSRLVGKHCIVADIQSNSCVPGGFMLCASTDSPFFLQASMSSSWYQTFIATYTLGGNGTIGNLSKRALEKQRFQLPSISEQEKIGNCFTQIDTHFRKTSTKLTKLRRIKQSLLEKMFV